MDSRIIEFLRSDQCESVATVNVVNHSGEWSAERQVTPAAWLEISG